MVGHEIAIRPNIFAISTAYFRGIRRQFFVNGLLHISGLQFLLATSSSDVDQSTITNRTLSSLSSPVLAPRTSSEPSDGVGRRSRALADVIAGDRSTACFDDMHSRECELDCFTLCTSFFFRPLRCCCTSWRSFNAFSTARGRFPVGLLPSGRLFAFRRCRALVLIDAWREHAISVSRLAPACERRRTGSRATGCSSGDANYLIGRRVPSSFFDASVLVQDCAIPAPSHDRLHQGQVVRVVVLASNCS